jgi:hypothetical protein
VPRTWSPALTSTFAGGQPRSHRPRPAQHDRRLWLSDSPISTMTATKVMPGLSWTLREVSTCRSNPTLNSGKDRSKSGNGRSYALDGRVNSQDGARPGVDMGQRGFTASRTARHRQPRP